MDTKRLLKNKILYCTAIFAFSSFFFGYSSVSAATLQINSNSATLSSGDTATLYVVLNSEGVAVNNAEATIKFPAELFDVISISKNNSIFSLWIEDPSFSNSTGIITFNGGVPTPGFIGAQGSVVTIVVRAKKIGQAQFVFSGAAVRANDGLGTNILSNQLGKIITIVKKGEPADIVPTLPIPALQISSLTHPNQGQWYKDRDPVFRWVVPVGSDAVRTNTSKQVSDIPTITYSPAINEKAVKDLEDGVWYFKVRARRDGVWGPISIYIVRIDATAPQKKDATFSYDDNTRTLNITADIQDITSGIDYYEVYINDTLVKSIPVKEFVNGSYGLKFNASGDNTVRLLAIDYAGNSTESLGAFQAVGILAPQLEPIPSTVSADEQLLVRGKTQNPDTNVTISIKYGDDKLIVLKTKSDSDRSFFVLTPKLKSGGYDIWAETGSGDEMVSSTHMHIEVTSQLLITMGSFTMTALSLAILIPIIILLFIAVTYLRYHYIKSRHKIDMHTAVLKRNAYKILFLLKKSLENNLAILKNIGPGRILTEEEKKIKEAIEGDLDEVDRAIDEVDRAIEEQKVE